MPTLHHLALLSLVAALWSAPADAKVSVTFQNSSGYADPDLHGLPVRAVIKAHLERLGTHYLGRNATLKIAVINVRLAGQHAWWQTPPGVRIMNEATWPVITVRYTLTQGGKVLASGEEAISDQYYLAHSREVSAGPLVYEKAMLDDWFRQRFADR